MGLIVLFLNGCSNVTVKDEIFYGNKGMQGAVEFHSMTPGQKNLTFEQWMQLIRTQPLVCSSVEAYGDMKTAFEQICSVCNCCTPDTKTAVETFFSKVEKNATIPKGK
jgi:hypothetical protein